MYKDDHQVDIPTESVDDAFAVRVVDFMQEMTVLISPCWAPSGSECGNCTSVEVPTKMHPT